VSRDTISRIEDGESIPTLHVSARLAHGVDKTLTEFISTMEDGWARISDSRTAF
jgi:transcriptional regulator with XRE-family HTH domain